MKSPAIVILSLIAIFLAGDCSAAEAKPKGERRRKASSRRLSHYSKGSKGYTKGSKGCSKGYSNSYEFGDRACKDSETFKFKTEFSGKKDCDWLSEKKFRQRKYCETREGWDNPGDIKVKYRCRRSCANYLFGDKFSRCGKHQDDDEPFFDDEMTAKGCKDDDDFEFKTENVGKKDCDWLAEKEFRKGKYCETYGWDGDADKKVKYACSKACRAC